MIFISNLRNITTDSKCLLWFLLAHIESARFQRWSGEGIWAPLNKQTSQPGQQRINQPLYYELLAFNGAPWAGKSCFIYRAIQTIIALWFNSWCLAPFCVARKKTKELRGTKNKISLGGLIILKKGDQSKQAHIWPCDSLSYSHYADVKRERRARSQVAGAEALTCTQ